MSEKPDSGIKWDVHTAVAAVAMNVHHLKREDKERVLLAVAVLYGIIEPDRPKPKSPPVPSMLAPKKTAKKR